MSTSTSYSLKENIVASARVKWLILKTAMEERLVYRGDFAFATLVRFLPIVTQIFLWNAIFDNASIDGDTDRVLNGYSYANMVAYYLLVMVARAFSSMPGLANGIALSVRDGSVRKYLIQPVDMLDYLFWHRIAHKLVYYAVAIGPFCLVFWLCRDYLPGWPAPQVTLAWTCSLLMAFLIGFLIESLIGLISFWFLEVSSLIFVYMMMNYFLSGHMIPLEWISEWIPWVNYLPFKYLAYFPAAILLGRIPPETLVVELSIQASWIVVLLAANRVAFRYGVRRYGAFGG
ncbi:MAG: ABC transporter permease [Fuerstiella sp.]|jgi:ABC-2 type transport system permease protein|nr:ABC transporter permease [Fuerstiella sp.]MCP4510592.1 ABC transporter permease [Fuerstiella sp.]MDG2128800.1 ABC-2 family transporter protein [Fuerstiella sp.]